MGVGLGKLLDHVSRPDIVAVEGITYVYLESLAVEKLHGAGVAHVLHLGDNTALAVLGEDGYREIHYANAERGNGEYHQDIRQNRMRTEKITILLAIVFCIQNLGSGGFERQS